MFILEIRSTLIYSAYNSYLKLHTKNSENDVKHYRKTTVNCYSTPGFKISFGFIFFFFRSVGEFVCVGVCVCVCVCVCGRVCLCVCVCA